MGKASATPFLSRPLHLIFPDFCQHEKQRYLNFKFADQHTLAARESASKEIEVGG